MIKSVSAFIAYQYYNPFIKLVSKLRDDEGLQEAINNLTNHKDFFLTCSKIMEYVLYKILVFNVKHNPDNINVEIEDIDLNLIKFSEEIKQHTKSVEEAKFISILLEKSWEIINRFFPISLFGFPGHQFISILINSIVDKNFVIEARDILNNYWVVKDDIFVRPYIYKNNDPHGILKDMEINYLKEKLEELRPDINLLDEMLKDGFSEKIAAVEKVLAINPSLNIRIEPKIKKTNLTEKVAGSKSSILDEIFNSVEPTSEGVEEKHIMLQTIAKRSEDYIDLRFNKRLSYAEIANKLKRSVSQVREDIIELANAVGLEKVNEEINKYRRGE